MDGGIDRHGTQPFEAGTVEEIAQVAQKLRYRHCGRWRVVDEPLWANPQYLRQGSRQSVAARIDQVGRFRAFQPQQLGQRQDRLVGQRLDVFVVGRIPSLSRGRVKALFEDGKVLVNGRPARKGDRVGLGDRCDHQPNELSGGQQQRVAIARALVTEPSLLLADEPTGNLDTRTSIEVLALFQELNEQGLTIAMVTHETDLARYARRIVELRDGVIVRDEPVLDRRSAKCDLTATLAA